MINRKKSYLETVEIFDKEDGKNILSVELTDILECLGNKGRDYIWNILYLDSMGDLGGGASLVAFEDNINQSPRGLEIYWDDLLDLSTKFYQVLDILIVGNTQKKQNVREEDDDNYHNTNEVVIECLDSSYWVVATKYEPFIRNIKAKFRDVRPVSKISQQKK